MKFSEDQKQKICEYIIESLESSTLIEGPDEDLKLVDHLSFKGDTISDGQEMIRNIVEQIYFDIDKWDV
jgi:hypothetical protein